MIKKEMKSLADLTNEPIKTINITDTVQMHILVESDAVVLKEQINTPTISNSSLTPIIQYKKGRDQGLIVINYDQRYQV